MKNPLLLALIASASVCAVASANTITFSEPTFANGVTLFGAASDQVTVTFSGAGTDTGVFNGDVSGIAVFPNDPTAPFFSIGSIGWLTLAYTNDQSFLQFDWGTQDNYNKISLYNNNVLVTTITGVGNGSGPASLFSTGAYVFDKITFFNNPTTNAFEIDNITTVASAPIASVPDGGMTLAMLGLAMAGIAVGRRKMGALA